MTVVTELELESEEEWEETGGAGGLAEAGGVGGAGEGEDKITSD